MRAALVLVACALAAALAAGACTHNDAEPRSSSTQPPTPTTTDAAENVSDAPVLTPAGPGLVQQCQQAATTLSFAVPCPTRLPLIAGQPVDCLAACVGTAGGGETEAQIFVLDVDSYDDNQRPSEAVRHLVIEARKQQDAPPNPCYQGAPAGQLEVNGLQVTLLACPPRSLEAEANMRHGEGAHAEHLLGYWDDHGIRYVVSVHGTTDDHHSLLEQLISSIQLTEP